MYNRAYFIFISRTRSFTRAFLNFMSQCMCLELSTDKDISLYNI